MLAFCNEAEVGVSEYGVDEVTYLFKTPATTGAERSHFALTGGAGCGSADTPVRL